MAVRLEGIHFLVTYRCTYACDHCFVWGSPDARGHDDAGAALERHRSGRGDRARRCVLRRRRAHPCVSHCARGGEARPRARPRRRHGEQLLLGDVRRRRQGVARPARRPRPGRPLALVLCVLRRGRGRGAPAQRGAGCAGARHPDQRARGRRRGRLRRPRRLLRRGLRGDVQGAGGRRARARASVPAARDAHHVPLRGLHRSGPGSRRPGRRAPGVPGHQRRQRLRRRRWSAVAGRPGRPARRRSGGRAGRLRPARPPRHPRDPRRRPVGSRQGRRPRPGALTLR